MLMQMPVMSEEFVALDQRFLVATPQVGVRLV